MAKAGKFVYEDGENFYPSPWMPIGTIYWSTNSTNPSVYFGGVWEQIKDVFIYACGDKHKAGESGGEEEVTLNGKTMPKHMHIGLRVTGIGVTFNSIPDNGTINLMGNGTGGTNGVNDIYTTEAGEGQPHNNMPPFLAAYAWKRTA